MIKEQVKEHVFNVDIDWNREAKSGKIYSGKKQPVTFSPPSEFGGNDDNWSPEHLLCSSLAACYITTFMHFAHLMQVEVRSISVSASVKFEKLAQGFEATRFVIRPDIDFTVEPEGKTAEQLFARAKKYCFISNSVKGEVIVEMPF